MATPTPPTSPHGRVSAPRSCPLPPPSQAYAAAHTSTQLAGSRLCSTHGPPARPPTYPAALPSPPPAPAPAPPRTCSSLNSCTQLALDRPRCSDANEPCCSVSRQSSTARTSVSRTWGVGVGVGGVAGGWSGHMCTIMAHQSVSQWGPDCRLRNPAPPHPHPQARTHARTHAHPCTRKQGSSAPRVKCRGYASYTRPPPPKPPATHMPGMHTQVTCRLFQQHRVCVCVWCQHRCTIAQGPPAARAACRRHAEDAPVARVPKLPGLLLAAGLATPASTSHPPVSSPLPLLTTLSTSMPCSRRQSK